MLSNEQKITAKYRLVCTNKSCWCVTILGLYILSGLINPFSSKDVITLPYLQESNGWSFSKPNAVILYSGL